MRTWSRLECAVEGIGTIRVAIARARLIVAAGGRGSLGATFSCCSFGIRNRVVLGVPTGILWGIV